MNNSLDKKNFIWNTIGSTFNSFTSLLFMIVLTRINGTNQSGIFAFCFSLACLLQIIGKYSGRTLLEIREEDPGYIRWMKQKIDDEPVKRLLAQM